MRFLITAGPTREPIDPVRYLSNRSSGKMGYAMAEAALRDGHSVVLISGPTELPTPARATVVRVVTSDEMWEAVQEHLAGVDVAVMCAAVADYKAASVATEKMKKQPGGITLDLVPTRDILASLGQVDRSFLLVGFAAETNDLEKNGRAKLKGKNCDLIVANEVGHGETGMEADENAVTILFRDGETKTIPRTSKRIIADALVKIFTKTREKCLTKKT